MSSQHNKGNNKCNRCFAVVSFLFVFQLSILAQNTASIDSITDNLNFSQNQNINTEADTGLVFFKSITKKHLVSYKDSKHLFIINPALSLEGLHNLSSNDNYFGAAIGGNLQYILNDKIQISAEIAHITSDTSWINNQRIENNLVPGLLNTKLQNGRMSALYIDLLANYSPSRFFTFTTGYANTFVGDGYRSVLLGNEGSSHPFFQLTSSFWKIDYIVQYHLLKDVSYPDISNLQNKYMTSHLLNLKLFRNFHLYAFEAVIWKQEDSVTHRGFDMSYLNPVIFYRSVEFQLGYPSPDNVLLGGGFRYKPTRWSKFYAQFLIDEFSLSELKNNTGWWANKYALQFGGKLHFKVNQHQIQFRGEYNMARPFMYTHIGSMQNYGSRLYPLAHPLGANFEEILFEGNYSYKNIKVTALISFPTVGADTEDINYGQNIYRSYTDRLSEYNHCHLQGVKKSETAYRLNVAYIINEANNTTIEAGVERKPFFNNIATNLKEDYIYLRLKTFLPTKSRQVYSTTGLFE